MKKLFLSSIVTVFLFLFSVSAQAAWHSGEITALSISSNGTVAMVISGWVRDNCTCYSSWPSYMCLDRDRPSFKEEYAMALSAKARNKALSVAIDETTCKVIAIEEF
ncbi:hypothetical protein KKA47_07055 [bacterium]|nr:hypothetical protein [bacterium]